MKEQTSTPPSPRSLALRREIVGLLCAKAAALALLYWAFFGPSARPHIVPSGYAAHLLAPAAASLH